MSQGRYLMTIALFVCLVLSGCSSHSFSPPDSQPSYINEVVTQTPLITEADTEPSMTTEPAVEDLSSEEEFVLSLIRAINDQNVDYLKEYMLNGYIDTTTDMLLKGLALYNFLFRDEKLTDYEFIPNSNISSDPNYKLYKLKTNSGIARSVIIIKTTESKTGYKFTDHLLIFGPGIVARVDSYFNAIKSKDTEYFYDYLVMEYEDSDAKRYTDPDHNKNYEELAQSVIKKYGEEFNFETMEISMNKIVNDPSLYRSVHSRKL